MVFQFFEKKRLNFIAVFVAIFTGVVLLSENMASAALDKGEDDYAVALGMFQRNRWERAADSFQKFLKEHPSHARVPYAQLYFGISLEQQKKYQEAKKILKTFMRNYPRHKNRYRALYRIAVCSYFLNDFRAAENEFEDFLKTSNGNEFEEWATYYLAETYYKRKNFRDSARTFQKVLKNYPESRLTDDSKFGLASCYESLEQSNNAISVYRELSRNMNFPRAADAQMNLATLYFEDGAFEKSATEYVRLMKSFPKSHRVPAARLNAGLAYYRAEKYADAIVLFDLAGEEKSQQVLANFWKGISQQKIGQNEDAIASLKSIVENHSSHALAKDALFQWASLLRQSGKNNQAKEKYLQFIQKWPKSKQADDSLHFAAECALTNGQTDEAEKLIAQFFRQYPNSSLRYYQLILQGRLNESKGGANDLRKAVRNFQSVISRSRDNSTRLFARVHLARVYRKTNEHDKVVDTLKPVIEDVKAKGENSEFVEALILSSHSSLDRKKYRRAIREASLYLEIRPKDALADQALATRSTAYAQTAQYDDAYKDLVLLAENHSKSTLLAQTIHDVAEIAYEKKNWDWSGALFNVLLKIRKDSPYHAPSLTGLGWCQFEMKKYRAASDSFARVVREYPDHKVLAPQAAYKYAECLEKLGDIEQAAEAFQRSFRKYGPADKASRGSEKQGQPYYYAYHSGLTSARLYARLKKTDQADRGYEKLLEKFPQAHELDQRLDEWAIVNYNAGRYKKSDEIFARLVKEVPQSSLADNARYSLAESDLNHGNLDKAKKAFQILYADSRSDRTVKEISLYRLIGVAIEQNNWKEVDRTTALFERYYPNSPHRYFAAFHKAESDIRNNRVASARSALLKVKAAADDKNVKDADWLPRVWVLLAELDFRRKKYADVESTVTELRSLFPKTPLLYQADDILGRCYKNQAKFDEARKAFQRVTESDSGRRTETAAKCQFFIAETHLLQKDYKNAQQEYYKVFLLYKFPQWQAAALFWTAQCDEALEDWEQAVNTYRELIKKFPKSEYARKAQPRLQTARKKARL